MLKTSFMLLSFLLLNFAFSTSIDSYDILGGDGIFSTATLANFTQDSSHTASIIQVNSVDYLKLQKPTSQAIGFNTGMGITFTSSSPKHVQFKFASSNPDTEDANLRIMDSDNNTLILFRAGKGGLIRVNEQQMISFYNQSVSTDTDIKLTQVDLKIDWQNKMIDIFVGNSFKTQCQFFNTTVTNVSKLLLYNLYSSISYWQDIVICSQICYSFSSEYKIILPVLLLLLLFVLV